jgi:hypothetical protein
VLAAAELEKGKKGPLALASERTFFAFFTLHCNKDTLF